MIEIARGPSVASQRFLASVALIAVVSLALGACADNSSDDAAQDTVSSEPAAAQGLTLGSPVEHDAGIEVRETMIAEHPSGTLFVAGFSQDLDEAETPPLLYRSDDGGSSWQAVNVGTPADGAVGNSDVDLIVGPDGTIYFLSMGFDRSTGQGTHVSVGVSRDVGATWEWHQLSDTRLDDRPWIAAAPDRLVHAIWNDGSGVSHAISRDSGASWQEQERINHEGHSSHLAVGPSGEVAVRITPASASGNQFHPGVDLVAVSTDQGSTWTMHEPPGERDWGSGFGDPDVLLRWVEPLAWDESGALFHLWSEGMTVLLGRSLDRGATWESWPVHESTSVQFFPLVTARGEGELAATWFIGAGDDLRGIAARIQVGADGVTVETTEPFEIDAWRGEGDARARDLGGEYLPIIFLADGDLGMVTPVQDADGGRDGFRWYRMTGGR